MVAFEAGAGWGMIGAETLAVGPLVEGMVGGAGAGGEGGEGGGAGEREGTGCWIWPSAIWVTVLRARVRGRRVRRR